MIVVLNENDTVPEGNYNKITDSNVFTYDVAIGVIAPQDIIISDSLTDVIKFCETNGFKVTLLSEICKVKDKVVNSETNDEITDVSREETRRGTNGEPEGNKEKATPSLINLNLEKNTKLTKPKVKLDGKKGSLISRLFRRKFQDPVEVDFLGDIQISTEVLTRDLSNGNQFRKFLLDQNVLTIEQCNTIDEMMIAEKAIGRDPKIIEVARREGILNESDSAKYLTKATHCEITNPETLDLISVAKLNTGLIDRNSNYFYTKVDEDTKTVYIGSDYSTQVGWHRVEKSFIRYKIVEVKFVEGVTKDIVSKIDRINSEVS